MRNRDNIIRPEEKLRLRRLRALKEFYEYKIEYKGLPEDEARVIRNYIPRLGELYTIFKESDGEALAHINFSGEVVYYSFRHEFYKTKRETRASQKELMDKIDMHIQLLCYENQTEMINTSDECADIIAGFGGRLRRPRF